MIDHPLQSLGLVTGTLAAIGWALVLLRELDARRRHVDRRSSSSVALPLTALLAAIGTTASALGAARVVGMEFPIGTEGLSMIASMGRGALIAGALVVLANYHPPRGRKG